MTEKTRGALYILWGEQCTKEARRSIASVEQLGLAYEVVTLDKDSSLADKARMYELSPFDETLFLDSDTVVVSDVSFGFEMAARHGVALAIAPACYARRQPKITLDIPEYNTGVVFFTKGVLCETVFREWRAVVRDYGRNDQWGFAQAVYDTGFNPFVLPQNWNLRPNVVACSFFGPIKIWHSRAPVPANLEEWNRGPIEFGLVERGQIRPYFGRPDPGSV